MLSIVDSQMHVFYKHLCKIYWTLKDKICIFAKITIDGT